MKFLTKIIRIIFICRIIDYHYQTEHFKIRLIGLKFEVNDISLFKTMQLGVCFLKFRRSKIYFEQAKVCVLRQHCKFFVGFFTEKFTIFQKFGYQMNHHYNFYLGAKRRHMVVG